METIANRIKQALELRNMKQADLVEKTKIGKSSISTYISGAYEPKQRNIYKIAQALNVNEAWLMGYDVPMEREISNNINNVNLDNKNFYEKMIFNTLNKLNELGKQEVIKRVEELTYITKYKKEEDNKIVELHKNKKEASEKEDKGHLIPIAAHDDNLSDKEKENMNNIINDFLKDKL